MKFNLSRTSDLSKQKIVDINSLEELKRFQHDEGKQLIVSFYRPDASPRWARTDQGQVGSIEIYDDYRE